MNTHYPFLLLLGTLFISACSSSDGDSNVPIDSPNETVKPEPSTENSILEADTNSLATIGCQNVVILNEFAYAACGNGIEIVDLNSLERNFLSQPADDISGDANLGVLFTQSGNTLQQFTLDDPLAPTPISTVNTNFLIFSGIASANGILAISGGSGGSNTEVFTYTATSMSIALTGIPLVDNRTGNPDVHIAATNNGATAFYSQDLGAVANWGIQTVELDTTGNILALPNVAVLTPGFFSQSFGVPFGPANFPLESEFLNDRLYVAHFAANGIEVIDTTTSNVLSPITLGYEPTNITTDGTQLFVVSVTRNTVDTINPITETIVDSITLPLQQPIGIAANPTHIAIADRSAGLIIATR